MAIRIPNVGTPIGLGEVELKSADWNDTQGYQLTLTEKSLSKSGTNLIRQLIDRSVVFDARGGEWGEAYTSETGRLGSASGTAIWDTNKYKYSDVTADPYVIIEATSLVTSDFAINNCKVAKFSLGKWFLTCNTGTPQVKRAQIYKTLFFGTNGSNARATATYITGLTALKTSISRDIGKRAYGISLACVNTSEIARNILYTMTFSNTTTNDDVSFWSNYTARADNPQRTFLYAYMPSATTLYSVTALSGITTVNNTGTDLESTEATNPNSLILNIQTPSGYRASGSHTGFLLCEGGATFDFSGWSTGTTYTNTDFFTTHSVPLLLAADETLSSLIVHDIPSGTLSSTINSSFCDVLTSDWETGVNVQFKLTNGVDDSGWHDCGEVVTFTAFANEPDQLQIKLIPKSVSPTSGYPSIKGVCLYE